MVLYGRFHNSGSSFGAFMSLQSGSYNCGSILGAYATHRLFLDEGVFGSRGSLGTKLHATGHACLLRVTLPKGSDRPKYRIFRVSVSGIVNLVLGRYLLFVYLDP